MNEIIQEGAQELVIEITPAGNGGGDQQSFAQAGVVATSIGVGGSAAHTPGDTIDQVHPKNLQVAGGIAVAVVLRAMHRLAGG